MFLKKSNIDELSSSLETILNTQANAEAINFNKRKSIIMQCLAEAANLFDDSGLESEAEIITELMQKLANENLSSDKMLSNLEHKGWVFNADDGLPSATNGTPKPDPKTNDCLEVCDEPSEENLLETIKNKKANWFEY